MSNSAREGEIRSKIVSSVGGVMTEEVGAVTGDLEVLTRLLQEGSAEVKVRYADAEEWYTVEGSPIGGERGPSLILHELHRCAVERLTQPGKTVNGNEEPASLAGLSPAWLDTERQG